MRNRLILLLAALAALLLLSGCKVSGHPLPEGMDEDAVLEQGREIVTLLNQGDFQEVYDRCPGGRVAGNVSGCRKPESGQGRRLRERGRRPGYRPDN